MEQQEVVRDLSGLLGDVPFALVGATALACALPMRWRQTYDLDITISISMEECPEFLKRLDGWTPLERNEGSWTSASGVRVDFIPAGPTLLAAGSLTWPRTHREMSLMGFRHVFARSQTVEVGPGLSVRVAPVSVIALLKIVAYRERPHDRARDLADLAHILGDYPPDEDSRRFSDAFRASGRNYEVSGAFVLGQELAEFVTFEEREVVVDLIARIRDESDGGRARTELLRKGPRVWNGNPKLLLDRIDALEEGLG